MAENDDQRLEDEPTSKDSLDEKVSNISEVGEASDLTSYLTVTVIDSGHLAILCKAHIGSIQY